jgi:hypothetical protein
MNKRNMFRIAAAVFLIVLTGSYAQSQTILGNGPAVALNFDVLHAEPAVWSNGRLLVLTSNHTGRPVIHVIGKAGNPTSSFALQIPGSDRIILKGMGRQPNGGIVAGGFSWTPDGRETTFLAIISADGQNQQTVRTNPYTPYGLAVDSDGTIWTAGLEMINRREQNPEINPNYLMVRHFDATGHLLGGFVPRSSLGKDPVDVGQSVVVVNRDTVGWLWGSENYFLISKSGNIQRFVTPEANHGYVTVALTGSGSTILTTQEESCRFCALSNGRWVPVSLPPSLVEHRGLCIYGSEDDTLVVRERAKSSDTFYAHFLPVLR